MVGLWALNDDMVIQQNKVATAMIYYPLLMMCIPILTLLASTNLSFIAPYIAGISLGLSWLNSQLIRQAHQQKR